MNTENRMAEFIEVIHRFYFDKCFENNGKLGNDEVSKYVHDLHQNLITQHPSWRLNLIGMRERYKNYNEETIALHKDCKPIRKIEIPIYMGQRKFDNEKKEWIIENVKPCALCGRDLGEVGTTRHHLIPVSQGGKGGTVRLHELCHNQIHNLFTEKELAVKYDTIEKLLEHPGVIKFVEWIKNKPVHYYVGSKKKTF